MNASELARAVVLRKAERAKVRLSERLETLATERLELWRVPFARKFPRFHGNVNFGMGVEGVSIRSHKPNHAVLLIEDCRASRSLYGLGEALDDIIVITEGYRLACPDDFKF